MGTSLVWSDLFFPSNGENSDITHYAIAKNTRKMKKTCHANLETLKHRRRKTRHSHGRTEQLQRVSAATGSGEWMTTGQKTQCLLDLIFRKMEDFIQSSAKHGGSPRDGRS